jgi:hypothetical protein
MKLPQSEDAGVQELLDREAIRDCLFRYCRAVDRCDADLMRSVYWPEATDEHVFTRRSVEDYIQWAMPILLSRDQTVHTIGNILIRVTATSARVESYFHAYERIRRKDDLPHDFTTSGRYLDVMEKRTGEWRILERIVILDSYRLWPDSADWNIGLFGRKLELGQRRENDRSHSFFANTLTGGAV